MVKLITIMKLATFLKSEKIAIEACAKQIGVSHVAVYRYINGQRIPDKNTMIKIISWSGGAVTANDFYTVDDSDDAEIERLCEVLVE